MGKLRPLWTPGGGRSGGLPRGFPTVVTGALANGGIWWDDFFATSVGAALALGHEAYTYTAIAGTNAVGNSSGGTSACGILQLTTGAGATDGGIIDTGQRTSTSGGMVNVGTATAATIMSRFAMVGTSSNVRYGFGIIAGTLAVGTNWLTDPDTTLATTNAIIFHRDATGTYGGVASTNMALRIYSTGGTDNAFFDLGTAVTGQQKHEIAVNGTQVLAYVAGVLAATGAISAGGWDTGTSCRLSWGIQSVSTTKTLNIDAAFVETVSSTSAR